MDYYQKYIKYKIKYINLKSETINQKNQHGGNIKMTIDDNINNKEVNAFGYTHSKIIGGCLF